MAADLRLFAPDPGDKPPVETGITCQQVIDWFVSRKTSTSRPALVEIRRVLALFAARYGPIAVDKLIGDDLVSFVESHQGVKAGNTVARWYRTIKQPFNEADRLGKITRNPFKPVRIPRGERGRDLTPAEFSALLRRANPFFRRVLIFLRYSGARPGELRELTWAMIAWTATGAVMTKATVIKKKHKTSATQGTPKPRKIHLPLQLVKLLLWLKRNPSGEFPFTNAHRAPYTISCLCTNLRRLRERAGFGKDVKLYGCRHMFGTTAILNGTDIAVLAELMGHTKTSTTEIYIHLAGKDEYLDDAVERAIGKKPQ